MCYSARIKADYQKFVREYGAVIDIQEFARLMFEKRQDGTWSMIPKAMRESLRVPSKETGFELAKIVAEGDRELEPGLRAELAKQRERLAGAEVKLASAKPTKKSAEDQRIASDKISMLELKLADLERRTVVDRDARIFPNWYAPVLVVEDGKRVLKPMRYHCRPAGMSKSSDYLKDGRTLSGKYNARRDNLERFWRKQFGYTHGIIVIDRFYENVKLHDYEHRELRPGEKETNIRLEFDPKPAQEMIIACLWSKWTGQGEELLSFAAITDEPPPEVAATGHDRCVVQIKPEYVDAWLNPDPNNIEALQAILDDRPRPYYEHEREAA